MSMRGVQRMMTSILAENQGRMSEANFKKVVDYAKSGQLTDGEKKALLQPASYLATSRYLKDAGVGVSDVKFEAGAMRMATELARTLGIELFPGLPNIDAGPATDIVSLRAARDAALGKGTDLGTFKDWSLQTTGADVRFATDVGGKKYPALVLDKPQWKDPAPRDVIAEKAAAFKGIGGLDALKTFVSDALAKESAYFAAEGVEAKSSNERFGIQNVRRKAFFGAIRAQIGTTAMPAAERAKIEAVLVPAFESLISGRSYEMETGSHTNYWPYWNNYADFLVKVLDQTAPGSDEFLTIKNRLADIFRRKTVFTWNREVNEKDVETSLGAALVYNPKYSLTDGHRVSLAKGSTTYEPKYEILTVKKGGLPAELAEYAAAQVYRDGDKLVFDHMGTNATPDRTGQPVPQALAAHIESKAVAFEDIGIRKLTGSESARDGISADWNANGVVNVATILIGWWGHCHNEAPANAMGIDPQKGVELYRADRGVHADKARARFSSEDAWDVVGAFTSDHEDGFGKVTTGNRLSATRVDDTSFIGNRNNGGHWLSLDFAIPGQRRVRIDAEVKELWHKSDPTVRYADPMERFRRDTQNDDGSFSPNPDWVDSPSSDDDVITVDAAGRQITVETTFVTLNEKGMPFEQKLTVSLDPTKDEFVKLADELSDRRPDGGGKIIEHWYNAKTLQYKEVAVDVSKDNAFARKEVASRDPIPTSTVRAAQETTYDSVMEIHNFVTDDMGLPFTFDTSAGMAVWNYPVKSISVDVEKTVTKEEEGQSFTYTTYRLQYSTMGGPSGDMRYIVKRDDHGKMVRALALDPMPDFAFRNEHWVSAPVALDVNGDVAYNLKGLSAGYLTDKLRQNLVTALWERQATILYASLSKATAAETAYLFETEDRRLVSFASSEEYEAAIAADLKVREALTGSASPN